MTETIYNFNLVKNIPVIETEAEQRRIIRGCHEGTGNSVEAKAMSGHFGKTKLLPLSNPKYTSQASDKRSQITSKAVLPANV